MGLNNTVYGNNLRNNIFGIGISGPDTPFGGIAGSYNLIIKNDIRDGVHGIMLSEGDGMGERGPKDNIIIENNIDGNGVGIYIQGQCSNNIIYHNNFMNNTEQVENIYSYDSANIWNDDYPSGGNYWSDHNPPDIYSGPFQNETGRDEIGDDAYIIDGYNTDLYPLIYPYGYVPSADLNGDGTVNILDAIILAGAFGSEPGDPNWNFAADINQDGSVNILDAIILAGNFGEKG